MMTLRRFWWCLAVLLLGTAVPAPAQDGLTMNNVAGFDGFYRAGRWLAVTVTIENKPSSGTPGDRSLDFDGQLRLISRPIESGAPTLDFVRNIKVPAFSTQRFFLYARINADVAITRSIELRTVAGRLLGEQPMSLNPLDPGQTLMVTISDDAVNTRLPGMRGLDSVVGARVSTKSVPDNWMGYDSASIVVVPQWHDSVFRGETQQALLDWVADGGTLLFLTGQNAVTYFPGEENLILPATVAGSARAEIINSRIEFREANRNEDRKEGDINAMTLGRLEPRPDSTVLQETDDGHPFLVRKSHGRGQILIYAVDLTGGGRELVNYLGSVWWGLMPMHNLAGSEEGQPIALRRNAGPQRTGMQLLTSRSGRPPNYVIISFICIIYAILVGPVNFRLLAKMKRFDLAWVTVPAIVATFSLLIYGLGKLTRGGSAILRELTVTQLGANDRAARATTAVSAFTPDQGRFLFRPENPRFAIGDSYRWGDSGNIQRYLDNFPTMQAGEAISFGGSRPVLETLPDRVQVSEWRLSPFDVVSLEKRGALEYGGVVEGDLQYLGRDSQVSLKGTLTNRTGNTFARSIILFGGQGFDTGEVANGASVTFDGLRNPILRARAGGGWDSGWSSRNALLTDLAMPPQGSEGEAPEDINLYNAVTWLDSWLNPQDSSDKLVPLELNHCYWIGVVHHAEPKITTNLEAEDRTHGELVITRIPLMLDREIPSHFVHGSLVGRTLMEYTPNASIEFDARGNLSMSPNRQDLATTFAFDAPIDDPAARCVGIQVRADFEAGERNEAVLQIYDYQSSFWVDVPRNTWIRNVWQPESRASLENTGPRGAYVTHGRGRVILRLVSKRQQQSGVSPMLGGGNTVLSNLNVDFQYEAR